MKNVSDVPRKSWAHTVRRFMIAYSGMLLYCFSLPVQAALVFNISGSDERVRPGEQFQIEWVLVNAGTQTENNVSVEFIFPSGIFRHAKSLMEGALCPSTFCDPGETVQWLLGDILPGETRSVYFSPWVNSPASNSVVDWSATALVGASAVAASTWSHQIDSGSVLELAIDNNRALVAVGDQLHYTFGYGNAGSSVLTNASLVVPIPGGLTVVSAPGGVIGTNTVTWTLGSLAASSTGRRYLTVNTSSGLGSGSIIALQNVELSGTYQGLMHNVTAEQVTLTGTEPLQIELRVQEGSAEPDEGLLVEVVVGNNSAVVQQNVTVDMKYPVGIFRHPKSLMESAFCASTFCDAGETVTWVIGNLLPGEVWSASFSPSVDSSTKLGYPIRWQARVQSGEDVASRDQVLTLVANDAPELSVAADATQISANGLVTWWFSYGNRGTAPLDAARLTVPLPAGVSLETAYGGTVNGDTVSWMLGSLPSASLARQPLTVRVDNTLSDGQLIALDRAQLSGLYFGAEQTTEAEHILDVGNSPLLVELRSLQGILVPGEDAQFEFVVSNRSTNLETGVTLSALYPHGLFRAAKSAMEGASCASTFCDPAEHAVWTIGNLLPGESRSFTFMTSAHSSAVEGNTADWVATVASNTMKRRRASLAVGISSLTPNLGIVSDTLLASPGDTVNYTFSLGNASSSLLGNPVLTVPLPESIELLSAPGASVNGNVLTWQLPDLPTDLVGNVSLTGRVAASAAIGTLTEIRNAELSGTTFGLGRTTAASHIVSVGDSPLALALDVAPAFAMPGDAVTVTMVVNNTGSTLQQAVELDLLYPAGMASLSTANTDNANCPSSTCDPGEHAIWALGNLQPGETRTIQFTPLVRTDMDEGDTVDWQTRVAVADGKQRRDQATLGIGSEFDFMLGGGTPGIISPVPNSTLSGASQLFTWQANGQGVDEWWLYLGSAVGLVDYYNSGNLFAATSVTATGIPQDGSTVYARLWHRTSGNAWQFIDATYSIASMPAIVSPVAGSSLNGASQVYSWSANSVAVDAWWLYAGPSPSGSESFAYYNSGNLGSATSAVVNGLPQDGSSVFVTLWYLPSGSSSWQRVTTGYSANDGGQPPPAVTLISPSGNGVGSMPAYTWNARETSTWYRLWVNDSSGNIIKTWFTRSQVNCSSGTGACAVSPSIPASGNSVWWVQSWSSAGNGPWSSPLTFVP